MKRFATFFTFLLFFAGNATSQEVERHAVKADCLMSGDLLFYKEDQSDMERAISKSTGKYTHVSLVECDSTGNLWVIEATTGQGVRRVMLDSQDCPISHNIDVYRLSVPYDTAAVITRAKSFIGQPYDDSFLPDNGALYCSELIYEAFLDADGKHLFQSQPMNFRDRHGKMPKYWKRHFKKIGMEVPEGVEGTNPTDMSQSPLLIKVY